MTSAERWRTIHHWRPPLTNGSRQQTDSASTTPAFATLQKAVDSATAPGDVIIVLPGTYAAPTYYQAQLSKRTGSAATRN